MAGMSKGFGNLMRQAQQMQKKMGELQGQLDGRTVEGEAGQGQVKATVTCGYELKSIHVALELVDPGDKETMQDLIVLAVNDAMGKARKVKEEEMEKITGGLAGKIPGLF